MLNVMKFCAFRQNFATHSVTVQRKCSHSIKSKSKTLLRRDNVEIGREDAYEFRG